MVPRIDALEEEEERLRDCLNQLPDEARASAYKRFTKIIKDPDTYATLAWSLPMALHHIYLGKWLRVAGEYVVLLVAIVFLVSGISEGIAGNLLLGTALVIWLVACEFYCLFRSQAIVRHHNNRLLDKIIKEAGL